MKIDTGNEVRSALRRFKVVVCLGMAAAVAPAQTKPSFEVASIKPAAPLDLAKLRAGVEKGEMPRLGPRVDGARAEYIYMTAGELIALAYDVKSDQIAGGWIETQRFDIVAKLPEGASKSDAPKMLRSLLEDRFKLALHRDSKEYRALALEIGEGGPKMKEASEGFKPIDPSVPLAPGEKQVDGPDGPVRMTSDGNGGATIGGERGQRRQRRADIERDALGQAQFARAVADRLQNPHRRQDRQRDDHGPQRPALSPTQSGIGRPCSRIWPR